MAITTVTESNGLSFDCICVVQGENAGDSYTPEQFVLLPIRDRIRLILGGKLAFFSHGEEVDRRESLNALRKWAAG